MNLSEKFKEYIYEQEGLSLRYDRFCDDFLHSRSKDHIDTTMMMIWLEAAYRVGAEDMAKHILSLPDTNKEYLVHYIRGIFSNE
jgi:hypothetical protein